MPDKFNLVEHTNHIMQIAAANQSMTAEVALQCFIANLKIGRASCRESV